MQVIILAAGFGTRTNDEESGPKALLPLGKGCVLDSVVTSLWVPGVTTVHVVHNNHSNWARRFKQWKKSLVWSSDIGRRSDPPYIKIHNTWIDSEKERRGALGDLAFAVKKLMHKKAWPGFVVSCCDNLYGDIDLDSLCGNNLPRTGLADSAITVRKESDLHRSVLLSNPSPVYLENRNGGIVVKRHESGDSSTCLTYDDYRFCGPFFLSVRDVDFLYQYVTYHLRAGNRPDNIFDMFEDLSDDQTVRAVEGNRSDDYYDVGTEAGYKCARVAIKGIRAAANL